MKRFLSSAFLLVLPVYAHAATQVGVFADSCSSSNLTVLTPHVFALSVCAHLEGQPDPEQCHDPFIVVRCRVTGILDSWAVTAVPNPGAAQVSGDPLDPSGGEIVIPLDGSASIVLYTVTVNEPAETGEVDLVVQGAGEDECPLTRYIADNCDWAPQCAETQPFHLVITSLAAAQTATWSRMKAKYLGP